MCVPPPPTPLPLPAPHLLNSKPYFVTSQTISENLSPPNPAVSHSASCDLPSPKFSDVSGPETVRRPERNSGTTPLYQEKKKEKKKILKNANALHIMRLQWLWMYSILCIYMSMCGRWICLESHSFWLAANKRLLFSRRPLLKAGLMVLRRRCQVGMPGNRKWITALCHPKETVDWFPGPNCSKRMTSPFCATLNTPPLPPTPPACSLISWLKGLRSTSAMQFQQQYSQSFEIQELNGVTVYRPVAQNCKWCIPVKMTPQYANPCAIIANY